MSQPYDYDPQFAENPQPQQPRYVTYIPYGLTPETYEERQGLRKITNTIGTSLLIVLALTEVLVYILRLIISILNLANANFAAYINDPAFDKIVNAFLSPLTFMLPFVIVFKVCNIRISGLIKFKKPKSEDILPYGLLGIAFCAIANITVSYMGSFFSVFGLEYTVNFGEDPQGVLGFMLTFISTAIIPPLVEEFICRGIILGALKKYGNAFAIIASSVIFGLLHGNFQQIPFAFLIGLVLGFITVKTGSIWMAVGIHAFNNAYSVVHSYMFMNSTEIEKGTGYVAFLIVSLVLGIVGVLMLGRRDGAYSIKGKEPKSEKSKIYNWFFASPTIIIFTIICILQALQYFEFYVN